MDNAANMIRDAISSSDELKSHTIEVFPQGSYANNTNVRIESDVDVCVMLTSTTYNKYPAGLTRDDYGFCKGIEQYCEYAAGDEYGLNDINSLLRKDADGFYFVDMLHQDQEMNDAGTEYYEWLCVLKQIIENGLAHTSITIRMKYQWLQEYFNSVVTDDSAYLPVPEDAIYDERNEFRNMYAELKIYTSGC